MSMPHGDDIHGSQTGDNPGPLSLTLTPDKVAGESPAARRWPLSRRQAGRLLAWWIAGGALAGAFVGFLWWVSAVPLRGEPPLQQLAIPNGASAAIERGEEPPGLPRQIELSAGQRLYVVNLDGAEHLIAGTLIRPGTSAVIEPAVLSADEVACTVHPSGSIAVALTANPQAMDSTLRGSLFGAPFGLLGGLVATLGLAARPRRESEASDEASALPAAGPAPESGSRHKTWLMARIAVGLFGASLVVLGALIARSPSNSAGTNAVAATIGETDAIVLPDPEESGDALFFVDRNEWAPLSNGGTITAGALDVAVSVSPYPPGRQANLDLGVTRNGVPVSGANVTLEYDMTVMEHGALRLLALPGGAGHYLMPLEFIMAGDFQLKVVVDTGDSEETMELGVRATR